MSQNLNSAVTVIGIDIGKNRRCPVCGALRISGVWVSVQCNRVRCNWPTAVGLVRSAVLADHSEREVPGVADVDDRQ